MSAMRQIILSETPTAPAVYLLDRSDTLGRSPHRECVVIELRGERHRIPWSLILAAAEQPAPDEETRAIASRYTAIRDAAVASLSGAERRRGVVTTLVQEGRRARDRGDVVAEEEVARTLDGLIGRWVDGVWVGGQAAIVGTWTQAEA